MATATRGGGAHVQEVRGHEPRQRGGEPHAKVPEVLLRREPQPHERAAGHGFAPLSPPDHDGDQRKEQERLRELLPGADTHDEVNEVEQRLALLGQREEPLEQKDRKFAKMKMEAVGVSVGLLAKFNVTTPSPSTPLAPTPSISLIFLIFL
jgi:hypothetical protein